MRLLIYLPKKDLAPVGGKIGVGFNIYQEIKRKQIKGVDFLNSPPTRKRIPFKLPKGIKWLFSFAKLFFIPWGGEKELFSKYDVIHFHSVKDLYSARKSLRNYHGITVLTSHSPVPMAIEMFDDIKSKAPFLARPCLLKWLRKIDKYSFEKADYIMFPCKESEEPYYNNWLEYEEIHNRRSDSFFYCPTGIKPIKEKRNCFEVRNECSIPENEFVICYVGRHNEVKGYDTLKVIGEKVLSNNHNFTFLICGKEKPLTGLNNNKWIEIGWTSDAYSYVKACDVFVLPNKETYFDLVLLEVLCLGKIVIASRTGGNKYFEKEHVPGIFFYDTPEEAISLIEEISRMPKDQRNTLGESNHHYFMSKFTAEKYVEKYLKIIEELK